MPLHTTEEGEEIVRLRAEVERLRATLTRIANVEGANAATMADRWWRENVALKSENARLRAALEGLVEYERKRHPPRMGGDEYPPSLQPLVAAARAALAAKEGTP